MVPIIDLLNKLKWSSEGKKEVYELCYYDRITGKEKRIEYKNIKGFDNQFFNLGDKEIPLHRIKKVYKNGKLIWERKNRVI